MAAVLLIDDDAELCELVTEFLAGEGFVVEAVHDGAAGLERALEERHDAVVLDVMLPGLTGFEVLRRLRERSATPVLMLTARGDEVDRIVGLEMGADDYLPKPFNPRELAARLRAVLRRTGADPTASDRLAVDDLEVDFGARTVTVAGCEVALTGVEFSLLEALVRSAGSVVSRDDLSRAALYRRASAFDRSLDVHLSNLRRKLGPPADGGERIKTVRGVGYQYVRRSGGS
jgi:two-component system response regulator CpxR